MDNRSALGTLIFMAGTFDLKKTDNGKFHFNLKAGNGEVILSSQHYESKASAENGIESVRKHAKDDKYFERKESKANEPFFTLNAVNGQIIGKSEMYSSKSSMENGIASVAKNAPDAKVADNTAS
jgi:uncharacterized protein